MIYCVGCGMELPDIAKFCPKCGKMVMMPKSAESAPVAEPDREEQLPVQAPYPQEQQAPQGDPAGTPPEMSVFVLGIVSIVLSTSGLPGLILSLITQSKIRAREQAVGPLTGKGKVGKTLATIALPVSIVFIILITVRTVISAINTMRMFRWLKELLEELKIYLK